MEARPQSPFSFHTQKSGEDAARGWQRPAPLKVESIGRHHTHDGNVSHGHIEYWAHEAEGGFHVPLTTPQITTVRSMQEDLFPGSHAAAAAKALQQLAETSFKAPPNTPQVQSVRAAQEKAWVRAPPAKATIASVRSQEEDVFKGSNDLSAQLVAAASVLPTTVLAEATSVPVLGTAVSVASFGRSQSIGPHAPLPTPTTTGHHRPAGLPTPGARTSAPPPTPAAVSGAVQGGGPSGTAPPPTPISNMSALGASVWGSIASAVHGEIADTVRQVVGCSSELAATSSHGSSLEKEPSVMVARAAAIAAVRRQEEEEVFRKPASSPIIDAIRAELETTWYRVPANSPQIAAVRAQMAGFRSEPLTPQLMTVRTQLEAFTAAAALPPPVEALRATLDDPLVSYKPPVPNTPDMQGAGSGGSAGVLVGWEQGAPTPTLA